MKKVKEKLRKVNGKLTKMETDTTFSDHILVATFWGCRQIEPRTTELWTTGPCGPNVWGPSGQLGPGNVPIVPYQKQNCIKNTDTDVTK